MSLVELMPALNILPRADKLRVLQFLIFELAKEEGVSWLESDRDYPIWAPYILSALGFGDNGVEALAGSSA